MPRPSLCIAAALAITAVTIHAVPAANAQAPTEFDSYWMVFLERADDPPALDDGKRAEIQAAHLEHLGEQFRQGRAPVAGPFGGGPDEPLRGIVLFHGHFDADQVRAWAGADPAVAAGLLKVRVLPWYTEAGALDFPMFRQHHGDDGKASGD